MSKDKDNLDFENLAAQASKKLGVEIDILRAISPEEILYLLDNCPFLQIVCLDAVSPTPTQFIKAKTEWIIHDYGDAMSSSPGRLLFGSYRLSDDDEDESGGGMISTEGKGTIRKQAFDTAIEMVEIAQRHGWSGIHIVDGHPIMMRAAWIMAEKLGLKVEGFEPSEYDIIVRHRVELNESEIEALKKKIQLKK